MNQTQHKSNNAVIGAPADWDQSLVPCSQLTVTRTEWEGMPAIISYWTPTDDELDALIKGSCVALWIVGNTMPPVALTVEG